MLLHECRHYFAALTRRHLYISRVKGFVDEFRYNGFRMRRRVRWIKQGAIATRYSANQRR